MLFRSMDDASPIISNFSQVFGLTEEEMQAHPHALFGDVNTVIAELQRRREAYGISYVTVGEDAMEAFAPVVAALNGT